MNVRVRSGVASASCLPGVLRSRASGRAARTNGRICLRRIGSASLANGWTAWLARFSARTAGRSLSAVGPRISAYVWTLPSVLVVWRKAGGKLRTAREMLVFSEAKARNTAADADTSCARSSSRLASSVFSRWSELIRRRKFALRVFTCEVTLAMSRYVGSKRAKTSWRSVPRLSRPLPAPLTSSLR